MRLAGLLMLQWKLIFCGLAILLLLQVAVELEEWLRR